MIADYYAIELLEKNVTATLRKKEMGHQPVRHLPNNVDGHFPAGRSFISSSQ